MGKAKKTHNMRAINDFERAIIKRILDYSKRGDNPNIASVIHPLLRDKDIVLDFKNTAVELRLDSHVYNNDDISTIVQKITNELVITVNLLDYLEKNGYVVTYLDSNVVSPYSYGQLVLGNKFIKYDFVDLKLIDLLLNFSLKTILVSQELIDFVEKYGYQSRADYNTHISINIAVFSLIITALLSVIGLIFNYMSLPPTKIDKQSIQKIVTPINKIYYIDSLENRG
jgi:hypothetical protein